MTAREVPVRQLFVVVTRETAGMRMRLVPVQEGGEQVAAVNRGLGIVPLEILPHGDHRSLTEVYHVFRRLELSDAHSSDEERLASACATWREGLAQRGIELRVERCALYGAPLHRSNWRADAREIAFRPWDVELTALAAGLRRLVKLDGFPPDLIGSVRQATAERGLEVEIVTPRRAPDEVAQGGSVTLLAARDASTLVEARDLEASLLMGATAPGINAATLKMGELLGYPHCCVERFTRLAEQNDATLAWALLPGVPHATAPPVTQWLQPGLALLSHSPCDLNCAASVAVGERLLEALETEHHGFAALWRSVTARVQVVDHHSNRLALAVDGRLEAGARITAADVVESSGTDSDAATSARNLVGRTVVADSGGLVIADGEWHAPYVADHRGHS